MAHSFVPNNSNWAESTTVMHRPPPALDEPAEERACYLVVVEGEGPGRRIRLEASAMTIGRAPPAHILLDDTEVSRRHCEVHVNAALGIVVTDLGSTNGTFIDAARIAAPTVLKEGALLRVGCHLFRCERLSAREAARVEEISEDLRRARDYAFALLPQPLTDGPVRASWTFVPCAQLGGDALGYQWLDASHFGIYLIDVSGHGTGAALHSASVLNSIRHRTLPGTDFTQPAQVMQALNAAFPMDEHAGMYFCGWYGVYQLHTRKLTYCSAGQHPAYLRGPGNQLMPLTTHNLMVGASDVHPFHSATLSVADGCTLYLFSDGVFEAAGSEAHAGRLQDFLPLLQEPALPGIEESDRLYRVVRGRARPGPFDDDFSLVTVTFL